MAGTSSKCTDISYSYCTFITFVTGNSSLTVVFTGSIGVGKSAAGNFFVGNEVFPSLRSFGGVTTVSSAATCNIAEQEIQIIDTPGFMDAVNPEIVDCTEIAQAFMLARNGVHALALVVDSTKRCDQAVSMALEVVVSAFHKALPYIFVIFTQAAELGEKESTQKIALEKLLAEPTCPKQLTLFLKAINNRYMLLESRKFNKNSSYCEVKRNELIKIVGEIQRERKNKMLTLGVMQIAREIYNQNPERKNNDSLSVKEFQEILQEATKANTQYAKAGEMDQFWSFTTKTAVSLLGAGIGAAVGTAFRLTRVGATAGYVIGTTIAEFACSIQ